MQILRLTPEEWQDFSEKAHALAFGEQRPQSLDRISYALLGIEGGSPMGYATCQERDSATVYWQFGGVFTKNSTASFRAYQDLVEYHRARYERVFTFIENTNTVMLKMAMKVGFRIVGIRYFEGSILLEHLLDFKEGNTQ